VGLFEAWGLWWQGAKLDDTALWGLPMLVVGRIGKVMAFVGSIVAVVDIIGPDNIELWAARIRKEPGRYSLLSHADRFFFRNTLTGLLFFCACFVFGGVSVAVVAYVFPTLGDYLPSGGFWGAILGGVICTCGRLGLLLRLSWG
jgi:hypothetical protein